MGLKQLINQQKIMKEAVNLELVLPGEPMIYSVKYSLRNRMHSTQFFRNMKWKSILRSFFRSYFNTKVPVVIFVRFFVSPPESTKLSSKDIKSEKIPAVAAYEICDYLLSFLEMLQHVLFNSYRQVVKVEADKFYSNEPRTVFKFMKWDHYVDLQNNNTAQPKSKSIGKKRKIRNVQSKLQGDVKN